MNAKYKIITEGNSQKAIVDFGFYNVITRSSSCRAVVEALAIKEIEKMKLLTLRGE